MKLIKKHKFTVFVILIYIILIIFVFFINKTFFSSNGKPVYGDRLDGIDNVTIGSEVYAKMKQDLEADSSVTNVTSNLSGRIVNVTITVINDLSKDDAKNIGNKVSTFLDENQLSFYDIQVFVRKDDETKTDFPIIGYKRNDSKELIWTKDR